MAMNSNKFSLVLIVTSLMLGGCTPGQRASVPVESRTSAHAGANSQQQANQALASAEHYLELAAKSTPPQSYEYQLMAAEMYIRAKEHDQATHWIQSMPSSGLNSRLKSRQKILSSELALEQGKPAVALEKLTSLNTHQLTQAQQSRTLEMLAIAHTQLGQPLESAKIRAQLDNLYVNARSKQQNRNALWQALGDVPVEQLENARMQGSQKFQGWVELALILRKQDVAFLGDSLNQWQSAYPSHPAQEFMPRTHKELARHIQYPEQIALLLPLTGTHQKAAEAIRDGFLTRYYDNDTGAIDKPKIQIYDTTSAENVQVVYDKAVKEGAKFVIGPLMKQNVLSLSESRYTPVPILALNQNNSIKRPPRNFIQFALAPEDEAEQIAEKAANMNFKNAAVIVPNNNWGTRITHAFAGRWQGLGGHIVSSVKVSSNEDQAKAIRALLNIDDSQQRSHKIKYSIKEKVNYQPRRRQDIDVVVMAAPPEQARQLKPLFNFYFAEDLQVIATSSVYSGKPTPAKDHDMNGVMFCDMPWLLAKDQKSYATRALIHHHWPAEANQYARLFAMGVDAYELAGQIDHLKNYPHSYLQGATGYLSLGSDYRIERKLLWATFNKGVPKVKS